MIWILRHIGVHLWLTALFAIPVSFFMIPQVTRFFPNISPTFLGVCIIIFVGFVLGFLTDMIAKRWVVSLVKEGQAWERSGILKKAKKNYIMALRVYDTFLLWPFSAQKIALKISGAIAAFQLNTHSTHKNLRLGTAVYLKMNPQDVDITGLWLSQIEEASIVTSFEQEVLSVLAQTHMTNSKLSHFFANIFLGLGRNDLLAKKIYQQVMSNPLLAKEYQVRIQGLVGEPKETIVKQAFFSVPEKHPPKKIEIKKHVLKAATILIPFISQVCTATWLIVRSFTNFVVTLVGKIIVYFKEHEKFRIYLKTGVLILVGTGFLFFMITTLVHTFKTRAIEKRKIAHQVSIPKPFTIQVAAYLRLPHAQKYVDSLKKKQIDASIKEVVGGGKTWFVIRVSKFTDKKSAADYGNKLKQQHIIDDFFVNNR